MTIVRQVTTLANKLCRHRRRRPHPVGYKCLDCGAFLHPCAEGQPDPGCSCGGK